MPVSVTSICNREFTIPESSVTFKLYQFDFTPPPGPFVFISNAPATINLNTLNVAGALWLLCPSNPTGYNFNLNLQLTFDAGGNALLEVSNNAMFVGDLLSVIGTNVLVGNVVIAVPPVTDLYVGIDGGSVAPGNNSLLITPTVV